MEDARPALPRPIQVAVGFLAVDALWCGAALVIWCPRPGVLGLVVAALLLLGLCVFAAVIGGLLRRERWALPAGLVLSAAGALVNALPFLMDLLRGPDDLLLALAGIGWFLASSALLLAGIRSYP